MRFPSALLPMAVLCTGWASFAEPSKENPNADADGQALVAQLLAQEPAQNFTNRGLLSVRPARGAGPRRDIPVGLHVFATPAGWTSVYETSPTNNEAAVRLTVLRKPTGANAYLLAEATNSAGLDTTGKVLAGGETRVPFARSDFWVADLGLEFFQWPAQRLVRKELRRGQSCDVLESVAPPGQTNDCVRVRSWIDSDTGGIVYAEAFDVKGRLVREFAPKAFKKVDGRWELEEMEIINRQTGSRTRLRFGSEANSTPNSPSPAFQTPNS